MAAAVALRGCAARALDYSGAAPAMDSAPPPASEDLAPEPVVLRADRPLDYAVGAALWAAGLSWLAPMMGLQMLMHRLVGPDNMQWLERLYTRGQVLLTGSRWHASV